MQQLKKLSDTRYVVVTDEPIKEGDFILINGCIIRQCDYVDVYMVIDTTQGKHHASVCKKITHSTQPLNTKFNDWFDAKMIDLSYIKSLVGEVDVKKKSEEKYSISMQPKGRTLAGGVYDVDVNYMERLAYKHGYNQCLEDNKDKRFSEEDLKKAIQMSKDIKYVTYSEQDIFDSLTQPKDTWEVEFIDGQLKLK